MTERRRGKRFLVDWPVRVEGLHAGGGSYKQEGVLQNISSGGAMMHLSNPVEKGTRLDLFILLPFKGNKWMKYSAHVIRIEDGVPEFNRPECVGPRFVGPRFGAAVKFKVARPEFATK